MLTYQQNQQLCKEVASKAGSELAECLTDNRKYFRGNESAILNYVISEARKDEMTSVDSIIANSTTDTHEIFNNENKRVLNIVKSSLLTNHCKNQEINTYVDNTIAQLNSEDNVNFSRNKFLSGLNSLLNANISLMSRKITRLTAVLSLENTLGIPFGRLMDTESRANAL